MTMEACPECDRTNLQITGYTAYCRDCGWSGEAADVVWLDDEVEVLEENDA